MSTLLTADGVEKSVEPEGKTWTLDELTGLVGGPIQIVGLPNHPGHIMVLNENGKLIDLPVNLIASHSRLEN